MYHLTREYGHPQQITFRHRCLKEHLVTLTGREQTLKQLLPVFYPASEILCLSNWYKIRKAWPLGTRFPLL